MRFVQAAVITLALVVCSACHPGPIIDAGAKPPDVGGTIAGSVRATEGTMPLASRRVTAVDVATGARHDVSTSSSGGYTLQVPKGVYRLEVELRQGEMLSKQPGQTEVNTGDLDPGRDFEITRSVTASR